MPDSITPIVPPDINATPSAPADVSNLTAPAAPTLPAQPVAPTQADPNQATSSPAPATPSYPGGPSYTTDSNGNIVPANVPQTGGKKGILEKLLLGALVGAQSGMAAQVKEGETGVSAGARQAKEDREEAIKTAKATAQTNFQNKQALDEAKLRHNLLFQQTMQVAQHAEYEKEEHPGVMQAQKQQLEAGESANKEHEMMLHKLHDDLTTASLDRAATLEAAGIQPLDDVTDMGKLRQHLPGIINGPVTAIPNGKTGDNNGVLLYDTDTMKNSPLTKPVIVKQYLGGLDKDGLPVATERAMSGTNPMTGKPYSYYDYVVASLAGEKQRLKIVSMNEAKLQAEHLKAQTGLVGAQAREAAAGGAQKLAAARLSDAQTEQLKKLGATVPAGYTPPANVFTMTPVEIQQDIQQKGGALPSNFQALYGAGHYKNGPETFPQRVTKGTNQMDRATAIQAIRSFVNPNYDENNYKAVQKMEVEFANPDKGHAGGTLIAFNTATGHLGQLYDAAQALQNGNVQMLNQIANNFGVATGKSPAVTFDAIRGALVGELGQTFKGAAPDIPEQEQILKTINNAQSPKQAADVAKTYAHLMLTKAGAQVAHYYAYTGELPPQTIDPGAASVYRRMGIDTSSVLPGGARVPVGQTGNINAPAAPKTLTAPVDPATGKSAAHQGKGPDGRMHWTNPQGQDLGLVQPQ